MIRRAGTSERWVALFLLTLLLFSPPFLSIFSDHRLLSVPFIYLYLFISWGLVIVLLALAAEGRSPEAGFPVAEPRVAESGGSARNDEDAETERED